MMVRPIVSHTYTVSKVSRELHWDRKAVQRTATLTLDKQNGGPVAGWGSLPHSVSFHGPDLCEQLPLGSRVQLAFTVVERCEDWRA